MDDYSWLAELRVAVAISVVLAVLLALAWIAHWRALQAPAARLPEATEDDLDRPF